MSTASVAHPETHRSTFWTASVCAGLSLCVSAAFMLRRPDLYASAAFLFGDDSFNLLVADRLVHGVRLYAQLAYPYGPLPIWMYAELSRLFHNSPSTYLWTLAIGSACSVWIASWLICRAVGVTLAIAIAIIALVPTMPLPGAFVGGYTSSIYYPFERLTLLAVLVLWRPLEQRSRVRHVVMGALCGLGQGIRFGTMPVLFAALVLVDMPALLRTRSRGAAVRSMAWCLGAFTSVEIVWVLWAFSTLPAGVASQFVWPTQLWETHQTSGLPRYPSWAGWRAAAAQYLMPSIAFALALYSCGRRAVRQWRFEHDDAPTGAAALAACFYLLGVLFFFRDEHHFRQFAWLLAIGATPALADLAAGLRAALALICLPALWPVLTGLLASAPANLVRMTVPQGYDLVVTPAVAARVHFLNAVADHGPVVIMPNGSGWLYGYGVTYATRHAWFYSPTVVRSFETEDFLKAASQARVIIDCGSQANQALTWPLPQQVRQRLQSDLMFLKSSAGCEVWKPRTRLN